MLWERQIAGRNYPPTNKKTLIRALTEEWDKLPQQLLDNVVQTERCSTDRQELLGLIGLFPHDKPQKILSKPTWVCVSVSLLTLLTPLQGGHFSFQETWGE
ncbi:hypothetical protein TNCV_4037271 [Trichonephila clavipes]|nr:hypothetical protein TNCV_4037271 [Trichonephila clavipes]